MLFLHRLCRIEQLLDPGSRGFTLQLGDQALEILVVRKSGQLYGYLNHCPHTGITLEWQDDQFLDLSQRYIQCATHGALFRIEDGFCLRGPCSGDALTPVGVEVQDGQVICVLDSNSGHN
ncbi:MAG: Rieske 2Fe-2S domain-containing protein [Candidatus Thiodiazotropha sp.]